MKSRAHLGVLLACAACSAPEIPEGRYTCREDADCPPRMLCTTDGLCVRGGGGPDLDAGPRDARPAEDDAGPPPACDAARCCRGDGDCDDANECTVDTCDVVSHACVSTRITDCCADDPGNPALCADATACTDDRCESGRCVHMVVTCPCLMPSDCDDGNPCTMEVCSSGMCGYNPLAGCCVNDADCDDGSFCNGRETCSGGVCAPPSGPPCPPGETCDEATGSCRCECDDGNPCTLDVCGDAPGVCSFPPVAEGASCSGALTCVTSGTCMMGRCEASIVTDGTCYIEGVCYAPGMRHPFAQCRECVPAMNPRDWSVSPNGTVCAGGSSCWQCCGGVCRNNDVLERCGDCLTRGCRACECTSGCGSCVCTPI